MKYRKNYRVWHEKKEVLDEKVIARDFYYHEREVWWAAVGANVGVEIDGKNSDFERPVLVLKKLNKHQFFGVPLTSGGKQGKYYVAVQVADMYQSAACLSQLRVFSSKRLLRRVGSMNQDSYKSVVVQVQELFKQTKPRRSCRGISEAEATNEPSVAVGEKKASNDTI